VLRVLEPDEERDDS